MQILHYILRYFDSYILYLSRGPWTSVLNSLNSDRLSSISAVDHFELNGEPAWSLDFEYLQLLSLVKRKIPLLLIGSLFTTDNTLPENFLKLFFVRIFLFYFNFRGEKIDTVSYSFEGEMIKENKDSFIYFRFRVGEKYIFIE